MTSNTALNRSRQVEPQDGKNPPKFTAAEIEGDQCPRFLQNLGKQITAHLEQARKAETKVEQHYTAVLQLLEKAKQECDAGGFAAFQEKFCPDLGRSRAYELAAIATGRKSIEDLRASSRERQVRCRARKAESVTVTDSTSITPSADPAATAAARKAQYAALDEVINRAEASAAARRAAYAAEEQQLDSVCRNVDFSTADGVAGDDRGDRGARHLKCQPAVVGLDPRAFTAASLPEQMKYLDAVGAKAVLDAMPLSWIEAIRAWLAIHDARPAAPASNSDDLELWERREPRQRLN
jgi:hypothetical protein